MDYTSKKQYTSPLLTVINVDQEISLVMTSTYPDPEWSPSVPKSSSPTNEKLPDSSPFGGDKPDYSKM